MAGAAKRAGVAIAGSDTKVVEHGKADLMYVATCGIRRPIPGVAISPSSVRASDKIIVSGPIGDHGITILLARGELDLEAELCSDTRYALPLVESLARDCGLGIHLFEESLPVRDTARGACELLGLDPRREPASETTAHRRSLRAEG
jgi:hydrogenase expression/formation protein HypE